MGAFAPIFVIKAINDNKGNNQMSTKKVNEVEIKFDENIDWYTKIGATPDQQEKLKAAWESMIELGKTGKLPVRDGHFDKDTVVYFITFALGMIPHSGSQMNAGAAQAAQYLSCQESGVKGTRVSPLQTISAHMSNARKALKVVLAFIEHNFVPEMPEEEQQGAIALVDLIREHMAVPDKEESKDAPKVETDWDAYIAKQLGINPETTEAL